MPTGNGITADTPVNLVVGAGVLLRNHGYFGASIDNNLVAVEREMFTPDLNGIMADLAGTDYITRSVGRIEATIPEVGANVIAAGIPGATVDTGTPGQTLISEATSRRIPDASYADWELDIDRLNGGQFQFEVDNAINTAAFEGQLQDDGLFAPRYVLAGRIDPDALTTSPWRIRMLDVAACGEGLVGVSGPPGASAVPFDRRCPRGTDAGDV